MFDKATMPANFLSSLLETLQLLRESNEPHINLPAVFILQAC